MIVLLLMLSVVMAWTEDRLSVQTPDDDMFIVIGCKVGASLRDCCQFSLKHCAANARCLVHGC